MKLSTTRLDWTEYIFRDVFKSHASYELREAIAAASIDVQAAPVIWNF
jgi:hypothetical protein